MVFKDLNRKFFAFFLGLGLASIPAWGNLNFIKDNSLFNLPKSSSQRSVSEEKNFPVQNLKPESEPEFNAEKFKINYTYNEELESFIKKQLSLYRPDYTSVVVLDNETGHILAALDYSRGANNFSRQLAFSNSHPAASIFKVITAADLLENTHIKVDTEFSFTGRSTTLYRHQLKEASNRRWTRRLDLHRAFATSNNVIFGRTAIENLTPAGLKKMAEKFGFNRRLLDGVYLPPSVFKMAQDQYNLAEYSSGLNNDTLMSPVHGAVIASVVANGGLFRYPKVIESLVDIKDGKVHHPPLRKEEQIISPQSADDLRNLFMGTITEGTARTSFRRSRYLLNKLEIGGKTGSLTGGEPYGKRDWFVSYAKQIDDKMDKGISVCVMIVNQKKWYVKSPLIAKNIMEFYYSSMYPRIKK